MFLLFTRRGRRFIDAEVWELASRHYVEVGDSRFWKYLKRYFFEAGPPLCFEFVNPFYVPWFGNSSLGNTFGIGQRYIGFKQRDFGNTLGLLSV